MTVKEAMLMLRQAGLVLRRTGHGTEVRVAFAGLQGEAQEAGAYYSDDLSDAVSTGLMMARNVHGRDALASPLMA